jgi:hypothetical protein
MKKMPPLLPTTFINWFEKSCDIFSKRGGGGIIVNDTKLVCLGKKKHFILILILNNNDHGVDVGIIIII